MTSDVPAAQGDTAVQQDGTWRRYLLADVSREVTVGHVGPMAHEYVPNGIPFLRSQDVAPFRIQFDDLKYISAGFHERLRKSALCPGDVVIVRTGRPGAAAVVPESLPVANCADLVIVRPSQAVDSRFLAYYINAAARDYVAAHLVGAVQQHFNVRSAKALGLLLPGIAEQRRIVRILAALDDKIDSNRRLAGLLEETAATLFRARFVEFVGVEEFEESEIGRIPRWWRVGRLADLVEVTMGQSPPGASYSDDPEDGLLLVQGMGGFGERYPAAQIYTSTPTKRAQPGTTLMTVRAPVGAVNVARTELCLGRGVAGIHSEHLAFTEFLVRSLKDRWASEESGTIFPAVNGGQIRELRVVAPPHEEIRGFDAVATPIVNMLAALDDESGSLIRIRDALLPKLISGQIRVPATNDPAEVIEPAAEALQAAAQ